MAAEEIEKIVCVVCGADGQSADAPCAVCNADLKTIVPLWSVVQAVAPLTEKYGSLSEIEAKIDDGLRLPDVEAKLAEVEAALSRERASLAARTQELTAMEGERDSARGANTSYQLAGEELRSQLGAALEAKVLAERELVEAKAAHDAALAAVLQVVGRQAPPLVPIPVPVPVEEPPVVIPEKKDPPGVALVAAAKGVLGRLMEPAADYRPLKKAKPAAAHDKKA